MNTRQKPGTPLVRVYNHIFTTFFELQRDISLQQKVFFWMIDVVGKKPKGKLDYDHWLAEPGVLARVLQVTEHWRVDQKENCV